MYHLCLTAQLPHCQSPENKVHCEKHYSSQETATEAADHHRQSLVPPPRVAISIHHR